MTSPRISCHKLFFSLLYNHACKSRTKLPQAATAVGRNFIDDKPTVPISFGQHRYGGTMYPANQVSLTKAKLLEFNRVKHKWQKNKKNDNFPASKKAHVFTTAAKDSTYLQSFFYNKTGLISRN